MPGVVFCLTPKAETVADTDFADLRHASEPKSKSREDPACSKAARSSLKTADGTATDRPGSGHERPIRGLSKR